MDMPAQQDVTTYQDIVHIPCHFGHGLVCQSSYMASKISSTWQRPSRPTGLIACNVDILQLCITESPVQSQSPSALCTLLPQPHSDSEAIHACPGQLSISCSGSLRYLLDPWGPDGFGCFGLHCSCTGLHATADTLFFQAAKQNRMMAPHRVRNCVIQDCAHL